MIQIGSNAFNSCISLSSINIPEGVTQIGDGAFLGCYNLISITVSAGNKVYDSRDNCKAIINTKENVLIAGCMYTSIPESVTEIGNYAFYGCTYLTKINIPEKVTTIGDYAFYQCTGLSSIDIPKSVTYIGSDAFSGCSKLKDVTFRSETPQDISVKSFFPRGGTLHVPLQSVDNYLQLGWVKSYFGNNVEGIKADVESLSFTNETVNIIADEAGKATLQLKPQIVPSTITNKMIEWISNDKSVATVDYEGVVSFKRPGAVTITCKATNKEASCKIICWANGIIQVGDNYYHISGDEAAVANCFRSKSAYGSDGEYYSAYTDIPSTITYGRKTYNVTGIDQYAFYAREDIDSITIPENITAIGDHAFDFCTSLSSINIPQKVTLIGESAFEHCYSLTSIEIPSSVESIGSSAFEFCSSLTNITIPSSVKKIEPGAFSNCLRLKYVTFLHDTPTDIKINMWFATFPTGGTLYVPIGKVEEYLKLDWVQKYFGNNVREIEAYVESISFTNETENIVADETGKTTLQLRPQIVPYYISNQMLKWISSDESVATVDGEGLLSFKKPGHVVVTCKANNAEASCKVICMANGIIKVGDNYYHINGDEVAVANYFRNELAGGSDSEYCSAYTDIPSTITYEGKTYKVTAIDQYAYHGRTDIGEIMLPETITNIGRGAFSGCTGLTEIMIPASVTAIEAEAFEGCTNLNRVIMPQSQPTLIDVASNMAFPQKVETLVVPINTGKEYKSLSWVKWYFNNVEEKLFTEVSSLDFTLPVVIVEAEDTLISSQIRTLELSVTPNIYENKDFEWTSSDETIATVNHDGVVSFRNFGTATITCRAANMTATCDVICYKTGLVYVGGIFYKKIDGKTVQVTNCSGGMPAHDGECNEYAGTINLPTQITHDNVVYKVVKVGEYAFSRMKQLQAVVIPTSVDTIADRAFEASKRLAVVTFMSRDEGLKSIGASAFAHCSRLNNVVLPNSTETIAESAFAFCTALRNITLSNSLTSIDPYVFTNDSSLNNVILPNSVIRVDYSAFRYCTSLSNITFGNSVSYINELAFADCPVLDNVSLPESMRTIQNVAFINDVSLSSIVFPKGLEGIGTSAFAYCTALTDVTFNTEVYTLSIGTDAFKGCNAINHVTVSHLDAWVSTHFTNPVSNPASIAGGLYGANGQEITQVIVPEGPLYISNNVFYGCKNIESITVPASIQFLNGNIIYGCTSLRKFISKATTPPTFIGVVDLAQMSDIFAATTLYVPDGQVGSYSSAEWWKLFRQVENISDLGGDYLKGDANNDGSVNVFDVTATVNYILGTMPTGFNTMAADVNSDGSINVFDVTQMVNIILGVSNTKSREPLTDTYVTAATVSDCMALQFTVSLPEGSTLNDVTLASATTHNVAFAQTGADTYTVIAYSMSNAVFCPTESQLVMLNIGNASAADVNVHGVMFITADGRMVNIEGQIGVLDTATSVHSVTDRPADTDTYNLQGQRIQSPQKGLNIVNGKKVYVNK